MRLIDADELIKKVKKWLPPDPCGKEEKEFPFETDICVSMPTMVELVRCEDCRYFSHLLRFNRYVCGCAQGCVKPKPHGYCHWGEKKG